MQLDQRFRSQYGVVTRDQADAAGLSRRQIDRLLRTREWRPLHRGVYVHSAVAVGWHTRLIAATLLTGGIASYRCAAALMGLGLFVEPVPEVTVPAGHSVRGARTVRIHRSAQWEGRQERTVQGIRCTGPERTIMDCGAVVSVVALELLAEAAIRKNLTTWPKLERYLLTYARSGRNGCGTLRTLFDRRSPNDALPLSEFSRRVTNLLISHGLPAPRLEYPIHDADGRFLMQADLAWPELHKAWELDGLRWHGGRADAERDRRKRNAARAEGWQIQEILWSMYAAERDELVAMARRFLSVRAAA